MTISDDVYNTIDYEDAIVNGIVKQIKESE